MSRRRGFALVSTLWALTLGGALTFAALEEARFASETAGTRVRNTRATWVARGCAAVVRQGVDAALAEAELRGEAALAWRRVDAIVAGVRLGPACKATVEAADSRASINSLEPDALERFFIASSGPVGASQLADAVLDWRDTDETPRPNGAEFDWYRAHAQPGPRNAAFESADELRAVRGIDARPGVLALVTISSSRVNLLHAPEAVLVTLPGVDFDMAATIVRYRHLAERAPDLGAFAYAMPARTRARLLDAFGSWAPLATLDAREWTLVVSVRDGAASSRYEQVIARDARGPIAVRELTP